MYSYAALYGASHVIDCTSAYTDEHKDKGSRDYKVKWNIELCVLLQIWRGEVELSTAH